MTKPDDIPQDVWDGACAAFNGAWDAHDQKFSPASNSISEGLCLRFIEASARAIMAEREARAKIAEDFTVRVLPKDVRNYGFDLAFHIRERSS